MSNTKRNAMIALGAGLLMFGLAVFGESISAQYIGTVGVDEGAIYAGFGLFFGLKIFERYSIRTTALISRAYGFAVLILSTVMQGAMGGEEFHFSRFAAAEEGAFYTALGLFFALEYKEVLASLTKTRN
ncbi:MAG: hypothetical protein HY986_09610 [Candidatus Melainabacteria bacterium]|nr:hypothetical protein [Candidatus Melainabacteria bacterium]